MHSRKSFNEIFKVEILQEFDTYKEWLHSKPLSKHTKRNYVSQVGQFLLFLKQSHGNLDLAWLDKRNCEYLIQQYKQFRCSMHIRPSSTNTALAAIESFFYFMGIETLDLTRETIHRPSPKILSKEELLRLADILSKLSSAKDRAVMVLFFYTDIGLSECAQLNVDDVFFENEQAKIIVRNGQGQTERELKLDSQARCIITNWLMERKESMTSSEQALFTNRVGQRISVTGLDVIIRKIGIRAGLVLSARVLRQTFLAKRQFEVLKQRF